jgi:hypothetical protein
MKPFEFWLPSFSIESFACKRMWEKSELFEDDEFGYHDFKGLRQYWLIPPELVELKSDVWWKRTGGYVVAVRAAHLERVDVINVGSNGYAFGWNSERWFPDRKLGKDLLDSWFSIA